MGTSRGPSLRRERDLERSPRSPYRPATLRDVPATAVDDLHAVIGEPVPELIFVLPASVRTIDLSGKAWVATPDRVLGVGADSIALWVDDGSRPGIRAATPFTEVLAVMDLTILLYGRLEIVGENGSFVVRYNAVNRPDLRDILLQLRRSYPEVFAPGHASAAGRWILPLKWLNVVRSADVQTRGDEAIEIVAGGLAADRPRPFSGVAVATGRELIFATEPTPGEKQATYGVDLVAIPRTRVLSLGGTGDVLEIGISAPVPVTLWLRVNPELRAAAKAILPDIR